MEYMINKETVKEVYFMVHGNECDTEKPKHFKL